MTRRAYQRELLRGPPKPPDRPPPPDPGALATLTVSLRPSNGWSFSFATFAIGLSYYIYTYTTMGRFTNMSATLFLASILIFLIGLVSEQITMLIYQRSDQK